MYKKVTNPIAIQSQKHICETMIHLLTKLPFDDITITMLCQEAQLSRKTFYRNFETKEDILICMLDYHIIEYLHMLSSHSSSIEEFCTYFFSFWQEKYAYLKTLQENALFYLLNRLYLHYIEEMHSILYGSTIACFQGESSYYLVFYIGGLCNLLGYWISKECSDSLEELLTVAIP